MRAADGGSKGPVSETIAAERPRRWHPMSEAPKDGTYLYLEGDKASAEWYWYTTRQFRKGSWQPIGWWRMRFGPKTQPVFNPTGWRRVSEGLPS